MGDPGPPISVFQDTLQNVGTTVDDVVSHVTQLTLIHSSIEALESHLSALDYAQLNVALAFTSTALYYVLLRVRGVNHTQHPIAQELERVKLYLKKVAQRVSDAQADNTESRVSRVNKTVAERIVKFYTQSNSANKVSGTPKTCAEAQKVASCAIPSVSPSPPLVDLAESADEGGLDATLVVPKARTKKALQKKTRIKHKKHKGSFV